MNIFDFRYHGKNTSSKQLAQYFPQDMLNGFHFQFQGAITHEFTAIV